MVETVYSGCSQPCQNRGGVTRIQKKHITVPGFSAFEEQVLHRSKVNSWFLILPIPVGRDLNFIKNRAYMTNNEAITFPFVDKSCYCVILLRAIGN